MSGEPTRAGKPFALKPLVPEEPAEDLEAARKWLRCELVSEALLVIPEIPEDE